MKHQTGQLRWWGRGTATSVSPRANHLTYGSWFLKFAFLMVSAPLQPSVKDYTWGAGRSGFGLSVEERRDKHWWGPGREQWQWDPSESNWIPRSGRPADG